MAMAWVQVLTIIVTIIVSVAGLMWMMTVMINKRIDDKTSALETLIKELIAAVNKRIDDNKEQIAELRKKLRKTGSD